VSTEFTIEPGKCWWCGADADSREHRLKASDLRREYGKPPYNDLRTLTRFSGGDRHDFRGTNSNLVKFSKTLCTRCNDTRSQPLDSAWDRFTACLADHEVDVVDAAKLDWSEVFGTDWRAAGADLERYVLKHAICRMIDQLPGPIIIGGEFIDFLNGGRRPALHIELKIDLGVLAMLRGTREAPPPEQPEAAEAGFLGTLDLNVGSIPDTEQWTAPSSGIVYRYVVVLWQLGVKGRSPLQRRRVRLGTTDAMFGRDFRTAIEAYERTNRSDAGRS